MPLENFRNKYVHRAVSADFFEYILAHGGWASLPTSGSNSYGWDKAWHHPRLLLFNMLQQIRGPGYSGGYVTSPLFATLAQHTNPSSELPTAPVGNLYAPYRMGKPFVFRGQWTFSAHSDRKSELGICSHVHWYENRPGGAAGPFNGIDFSGTDGKGRVFTDPRDIARLLQSQMEAEADGWIRVRYLDEREGYNSFFFVIESEYGHKFEAVAGHNWLQAMGIPIATAGTYMTSRNGCRCMHEREFLIWDLGVVPYDRGPIITGGTSAWGEAICPTWFSMIDCNFDEARPSATPEVAHADKIWDDQSGGSEKMVLYASGTLADLENDWLNNTKFVEGENKWTFWKNYGPSGPGAVGATGWRSIYRSLGRAWGTDNAAPNVYASGGIPTKYAFPCRALTANLYKWGHYISPHVGGTPPIPYWISDLQHVYRYWMLLMVNRQNPAGRLAIGGPVVLDPGWVPTHAPNRQWRRYPIERTRQFANEFGDITPQQRGGARGVRYTWSQGQFLDTFDQYLLTEGLAMPRVNAAATADALHAIRTERKKVGGLGRPVILIDPLYDPLASTNENYRLGLLKLPHEKPEWVQGDGSTVEAEDPAYETTLYGRGTLLGYARFEPPGEANAYDQWESALEFTEIHEGGD